MTRCLCICADSDDWAYPLAAPAGGHGGDFVQQHRAVPWRAQAPAGVPALPQGPHPLPGSPSRHRGLAELHQRVTQERGGQHHSPYQASICIYTHNY